MIHIQHILRDFGFYSILIFLTGLNKIGCTKKCEFELEAVTRIDASQLYVVFDTNFLEYDEKNDVTIYQMQVPLAGRNGTFARDEYVFLIDNNCEYLVHADGKETHPVEFDDGLCRTGLKIHSDNFTFKAPAEGDKSAPLWTARLYTRGKNGFYSARTYAANATAYLEMHQGYKAPNCFCRDGKGVLCDGVYPPEENMTCYSKRSNSKEEGPVKCEKLRRHDGVDGDLTDYPVVGCRVSVNLIEKLEDRFHECASAKKCPQYGMTPEAPGEFSYCCNTNLCNPFAATDKTDSESLQTEEETTSSGDSQITIFAAILLVESVAVGLLLFLCSYYK